MNLEKFVISFEAPCVEEFAILRAKIGWGEIDHKLAKNSLDNSLFHVVIRADNKLIGMARIVGDGFMYFYIQDVIVDPDHQKQGLGDVLMQHIENYLSAAAKNGSTIGLLAAKGKEKFYSRFGYTLRPNASLGNGMCKFV